MNLFERKKNIFFWGIILYTTSVFGITPIIDSLGQRSDGSKLFDIWYSIEDLDSGCIEVRFTPITEDDETLTCETFITPSDTGEICSEGSGYHVLWDAGTDVPDREFYENQVRMRVQAMSPGIIPGPCPVEPRIACGYSFTIALKPQREVWGWGNNTLGELGDGTSYDRHTPGRIYGNEDIGFTRNIIAATCGEQHTISIRLDKTVWTSGYNCAGQLGDGTNIFRSIPTQVLGADSLGYLTNIVAVEGRFNNSFALDSDGTVWAWGDNIRSQIGDGTAINRYTPVKVLGEGGVGFLSDIIAIDVGGFHSVALAIDSTLWTWGHNVNGQLGDGTRRTRSTPIHVHDEADTGFFSDVIEISAGRFHTMALKSDGTVWTWGNNISGQLGDGSRTDKYIPGQVLGEDGVGFLTDVVSIEAGRNSSFAIKSDGTLWGWGDNNMSELGDGTTINRDTPIQVHGEGDVGFLTDIVQVAPGEFHVAALKSDGTVWAWGDNNNGQVGDGTTIHRLSPVQVHGEDDEGFFNVYD